MATTTLSRVFQVLLAATGSLSAQSWVPVSPGHGAAEQAWTALEAQRRSAADVKVTKIRDVVAASREEATKVKSEHEARARQFRATAQAAQEFHTRNPQHPKAAEARQLEALAGLEGLLPADKPYERAALAVATAFRTNPAYPAAARFEVAHAMERRTVGLKTLGRPWYAHPALGEMMLDRLHREFGDLPQVWASYLALARHTDCDSGRDVALRIVQSRSAPEPTIAAARSVLERYALVRQPLDFPLTPTQGRPTTLAQVAGKTTIVCFWDGTRHPEGPPGLHDFKKNPLPNTKWVYVSLGALTALPPRAKSASTPPGITCVEALGWKSHLVANLRLSELPYAFVLDAQQRLSGYGRIEEIPALLAGIGRPVLP